MVCVFVIICRSMTLSAEVRTAIPQNALTIEEFNQKGLSFGTYYIDGYVIEKYTCPDCVVPDQCKPCGPEHIVISQDKRRTLDSISEMGREEMLIIVEKAEEFRKRRKYRFLVQVLDVKTQNRHSNNCKLIYYETIH